MDLLPDRRGRLSRCQRFGVHSGGAPANVAVGLARLGVGVAFRGVVGDDEFGRLLARKLEAEGIECHLRFAPEARTGLWFVALDHRGERTFFSPNGRTSADKLVAPGDVDPALLGRARWLHCGSCAHVLPSGRAALRTAVAAARRLGTRVSFDPIVRAHRWPDLRELRRLCDDVLPACSLVKLSEEEAEACVGTGDPERALARLAEMGVAVACVTRGRRGALLRRGRDRLRVPAEPVRVVDATGAGDGFVAGLLASLAREDPAAVAPDRLARAGRLAARVAARVCTRLGAVAGLPTRREIPN